MIKNDGNMTKEITLILPESVEVIDLSYYWRTATGSYIKTTTAIMGDNCNNGNRVMCALFEEGE